MESQKRIIQTPEPSTNSNLVIREDKKFEIHIVRLEYANGNIKFFGTILVFYRFLWFFESYDTYLVCPNHTLYRTESMIKNSDWAALFDTKEEAEAYVIETLAEKDRILQASTIISEESFQIAY